MKEEQRKYNLTTTIAMIIGIVIGSGIFFKADDILLLTGGSVAVGCIVLILGAFSIIFGGMTIAEWAKITDDAGGLISYGEKAFGKKFAFFIGWFQMSVYFPTLASVVCWVGANYTIQLFSNVTWLKHFTWQLTLFYMILFFVINTCAPKIAGYLQTSATIIKIIPLIIIAILGIFLGDSSTFDYSSITGYGILSSGSAIVAAAFSYDGWSIAPSICHEIKHAKRNLPIALTLGPIIILCIYLLYFLGICFLLGPDTILEAKDLAFDLAATKLAGPTLARLLLVGVVISVLGTCNGLILGSCRIPHALAIRKELPFYKKIAVLHPKFDTSILSNCISFVFCLLWLGIHYLTIEHHLFQSMQLDVSGIPIVIMYVFYFILYIGVIRYALQGNIKNKFFGYICPFLACISGLIVIVGGMFSSNGGMYVLVSLISIASGYIVLKVMSHKKNV